MAERAGGEGGQVWWRCRLRWTVRSSGVWCTATGNIGLVAGKRERKKKRKRVVRGRIHSTRSLSLNLRGSISAQPHLEVLQSYYLLFTEGK